MIVYLRDYPLGGSGDQSSLMELWHDDDKDSC